MPRPTLEFWGQLSLDSEDRKLCPLFPSLPAGCQVCPGGVWLSALGTWGQGALLAQPGNGLSPDFHLCHGGKGHREVLRGERASAGLGREGKARPPLLFQKSALNVTPRRKGSRRNTPCPPPPPPFSMETRKRRRSRLCYGKVSPWSETVWGVCAGSELPVQGRGGGGQGEL